MDVDTNTGIITEMSVEISIDVKLDDVKDRRMAQYITATIVRNTFTPDGDDETVTKEPMGTINAIRPNRLLVNSDELLFCADSDDGVLYRSLQWLRDRVEDKTIDDLDIGNPLFIESVEFDCDIECGRKAIAAFLEAMQSDFVWAKPFANKVMQPAKFWKGLGLDRSSCGYFWSDSWECPKDLEPSEE